MNIPTQIITESYEVLDADCYLGVNCDKPITITLPVEPTAGKVIIIKAEMKPPIGNKIITIKSKDRLIDGYSTRTIQVSNECVRLVFHDHNWRIW
jgi:hypothetical protein